MTVSKVTRNYQITIPSGLRKLLRVQIGSMVGFTVEKGRVILTHQALVDGDQSWFWSKEWQKGEREATEDRRKGRTRKFKSVSDMKAHYARKKRV